MNMMLAPFHMSFFMFKVYANIGALYIDKRANIGALSLCIFMCMFYAGVPCVCL